MVTYKQASELSGQPLWMIEGLVRLSYLRWNDNGINLVDLQQLKDGGVRGIIDARRLNYLTPEGEQLPDAKYQPNNVFTGSRIKSSTYTGSRASRIEKLEDDAENRLAMDLNWNDPDPEDPTDDPTGKYLSPEDEAELCIAVASHLLTVSQAAFKYGVHRHIAEARFKSYCKLTGHSMDDRLKASAPRDITGYNPSIDDEIRALMEAA